MENNTPKNGKLEFDLFDCELVKTKTNKYISYRN